MQRNVCTGVHTYLFLPGAPARHRPFYGSLYLQCCRISCKLHEAWLYNPLSPVDWAFGQRGFPGSPYQGQPQLHEFLLMQAFHKQQLSGHQKIVLHQYQQHLHPGQAVISFVSCQQAWN